MIAAVVLIAAGAILIVTGNNKNLLGNDTKEAPKEEEKKEEPKEDEPKEDPKRSTPRELTIDEAYQILQEQYALGNHAEEGWSIQAVLSIEAGLNNSFFVAYEEIGSDGLPYEKVTIIFLYDGSSSAELPGWFEGERDVSEYHFGEKLNQQQEQPQEEPPVEEELTEEQIDEINRVTEEQTTE